ncbi:hypothetical protein PGT21_010615 [Puccinia graminis f. sp. tritici]|uniref:Uncharacterized protein n=1 Tax=Puccinia graminis f. sp. tritici TaxID=56615 RepID=A0A5B0RSC7_PUCGR|nr:hypothetical protein PGT21_010615 [Puccinia graminis f. sp. tritici]KAA1128239.1 hypothetical protein PGTUg99_013044 [Puccinia graminis f. sp. tritici]
MLCSIPGAAAHFQWGILPSSFHIIHLLSQFVSSQTTSHSTMLDLENTARLKSDVCKAFRSLSSFCCPRSMTPENDDYEPTISTDQIYFLTSLLIDMRTALLPSLRQCLNDLVLLLHPSHFLQDPQANLRASLEITSQLADIMEKIRFAVCTVTLAQLDVFEFEDHLHGIAKSHRTQPLLHELNMLMSHDLRVLFRKHVKFIQGWKSLKEDRDGTYSSQRRDMCPETKLTSDHIDKIVQSLEKSDFGLIQASWQAVVNSYDHGFADLIEYIIKSGSVTNSSIAPTNNWVETPRSRLRSLLQAAIPFFKLGRIYLNKLSSNPISRPPFTIQSQISSTELNAVKDKTYMFSLLLLHFNQTLVDLTHSYRLHNYQSSLKDKFENILKYFNASVELFSRHSVPLVSTNQLPLPRSNTMFKNHFSLVIDQFRLAAQNFSLALERSRN